MQAWWIFDTREKFCELKHSIKYTENFSFLELGERPAHRLNKQGSVAFKTLSEHIFGGHQKEKVIIAERLKGLKLIR